MSQHLGKKYENDLINFLTRFGYATRTGPYCKLHGAYIQYTKVQHISYINGCQDKEQIIPVTLFLIMLFNACFTYQKSKANNMLVDTLDTFNLNTTLSDNTFMNTLSKYILSNKLFNFGISCGISSSQHILFELYNRWVIFLCLWCWMFHCNNNWCGACQCWAKTLKLLPFKSFLRWPVKSLDSGFKITNYYKCNTETTWPYVIVIVKSPPQIIYSPQLSPSVSFDM